MIRASVLSNYLGKILMLIGGAMLLCLPLCLYYHEDVWRGFLLSGLITLAVGATAIWYGERPEEGFTYKEGFVIVSLGWLLVSVFGALPYIFTGTAASIADAFFESTSGFTTTGATVYGDVEALPLGILFWRAMTSWLGGMGIIALFVAVIAGVGARANQIFRAEVPGLPVDKLSPRMQENAKLLWKTYIALTVVLFLLLWAAGMNAFDAVCHAFCTICTGGFSTQNTSFAAYSPLIQWITIAFMFIGGVNFSLHYLFASRHKLSVYGKNEEFRMFALLTVGAAALVGVSLVIGNTGGTAGGGVPVRLALFEVLATITTTGFTVGDYDAWPELARYVLFLLMFIGACAGSTSGNMKVGRHLIMLKRGAVELKQMVHPRSVHTVKINGETVSEAKVLNVLQFFFLYFFIAAVATMVLVICDGLNVYTGMTGAVAALGNIGPATGVLGPTANYGFLSVVSKYVLALTMIVGRLEIFPVLLLFVPEFWRR
ncbi:MAG: TrkH family potassium uptake protein [Syntrophomonadaceae bacterium]|nr:TrkH family potassium uptake protein [Syntrophomonadaceae bacterium]